MRKQKLAILQKSLKTDLETLEVFRSIYGDEGFKGLRPTLKATAELIKDSIAQTKREITEVKEERC